MEKKTKCYDKRGDQMIVEILDTYEKMSDRAAEILKEAVNSNPAIVLGLPTGSSPVGMYKRICDDYQRGELDLSQATTFNLDEYIGLSPEHEQSYHHFMATHLFDCVNLRAENIHLPHASGEEKKAACEGYEQKIQKAGGIDLQILGIGRNGHIGFNEPGNPFESRTHVVKLHRETREVNARFFDSLEEVPEYSMTMGIKTIMRSKRILLLATGEKKCEAIRKTLYGPITPDFPASVLQLHPDCRILVDKAAGQLLEMNSGTMAV